MGKVANAIGKTRGKNGKTSKCVEKQEKESTDGFQNNISRHSCFALNPLNWQH